ncbi:hypothetical protein B0O99DRAFT_219471 [Bisporella sp. PMI_857]|nr:hypothetical protein B0O99DRAFT_219471 [Bisporella sp. PMI_857]
MLPSSYKACFLDRKSCIRSIFRPLIASLAQKCIGSLVSLSFYTMCSLDYTRHLFCLLDMLKYLYTIAILPTTMLQFFIFLCHSTVKLAAWWLNLAKTRF